MTDLLSLAADNR